MAGLGVGLAVGLGSPSAGGGPPPIVNPNLLTWTEAFDNAAWVKAGAVVTANFGLSPLGDMTADQIENTTGTASFAEISTTAAASGLASAMVSPVATWTRYSCSATFSSGIFTFSIWLMDPSEVGYSLTVRADVSGGFIRCRVQDAGDNATFLAWGAKLETGGTATGTASTYGMRTT